MHCGHLKNLCSQTKGKKHDKNKQTNKQKRKKKLSSKRKNNEKLYLTRDTTKK